MSRRQSRPNRVGDTLRHVVQRIAPDRPLAGDRLWTFWDEVVGATLAARAQPAGFRDGVLSVRVGGAAWMQELQFMKEDLRERLNARLGAALIRDVYFVSGTVEPPPATRTAAPRCTDGGAPVELPALRDPRLAEVFARIARAHHRPGQR